MHQSKQNPHNDRRTNHPVMGRAIKLLAPNLENLTTISPQCSRNKFSMEGPMDKTSSTLRFTWGLEMVNKARPLLVILAQPFICRTSRRGQPLPRASKLWSQMCRQRFTCSTLSLLQYNPIADQPGKWTPWQTARFHSSSNGHPLAIAVTESSVR